MKDQLTLDMQQTKKADSGFNPLDAFVMLRGDCLEKMFYLTDYKIDMVLADLPYGTTACKWDTPINLHVMWWHFKRLLRDNVPIVLFASQPFASNLIMTNPDLYKYEIIWEKCSHSNPLLVKKQILRRHESILVFYSKQCKYYPQMVERLDKNKRNNSKDIISKIEIIGTNFNSSQRNMTGNEKLMYPSSIQKFNKERKSFHPVNKPIKLLEWLLKTYTDEDDTVLDITMGSGSTGVACKNLNRRFIGIEKDEKYFEIAKQRIKAT